MLNDNKIEQFLNRYGPCLSSEIVSYIMKNEGVSPEAARQRVSRVKGEVQKLEAIKFSDNKKFLFLSSQYNTIQFWESLLEALKNSSLHSYMALMAIKAHGGYVKTNFFNIVSGSPLKQAKHVGSEQLLQRLLADKILIQECVEDQEFLKLNSFGKLLNSNYRLFKAQEKIENILLDAVKSWAIKLNFSSKNTLKTRNENNVNIGSVRFDLSGPTYLYPIKKYSKNQKNGFFVCDIIYSTLDHENILYFKNKCDLLLSQKNIGKIFPMLIGESFSPNALEQCRGEGIIATTPTSLFGKDIAESLNDLLYLLKKVSHLIIDDISKIDVIFSTLSKIEGQSLNIRGDMFEMIAAYIQSKNYGGVVSVGEKVQGENGKFAEIDILALKHNEEVRVIECKGYYSEKQITIDEIKKWHEEKIPIIKSYLKSQIQYQKNTLFFEFWTTGKFSAESIEYLEENKNFTKKYHIAWKDGTQIIDYAKDKKLPKVIEIIKNNYFKCIT